MIKYKKLIQYYKPKIDDNEDKKNERIFLTNEMGMVICGNKIVLKRVVNKKNFSNEQKIPFKEDNTFIVEGMKNFFLKIGRMIMI